MPTDREIEAAWYAYVGACKTDGAHLHALVEALEAAAKVRSEDLSTELKARDERIAELENVIKEADDYLDYNKLTTICSTSYLHRKFKQALGKE